MTSAGVRLIRSKYVYEGNFLISSTIPYDCVLGWDFVVSNKLDLHVTGREGDQYYCLVGPHGTTPISAARPPQEVHLSRVVEAGLRSPEPAGPTGGSDTLLVQSRLKGPTSVKLVGDIVIPARTEIIV